MKSLFAPAAGAASGFSFLVEPAASASFQKAVAKCPGIQAVGVDRVQLHRPSIVRIHATPSSTLNETTLKRLAGTMERLTKKHTGTQLVCSPVT